MVGVFEEFEQRCRYARLLAVWVLGDEGLVRIIDDLTGYNNDIADDLRINQRIHGGELARRPLRPARPPRY